MDERHRCAETRALLDEAPAVADALLELATPIDPPDGFAAAVLARITSPPPDSLR